MFRDRLIIMVYGVTIGSLIGFFHTLISLIVAITVGLIKYVYDRRVLHYRLAWCDFMTFMIGEFIGLHVIECISEYFH